MDLDPAYAVTWFWYAEVDWVQGRPEDAAVKAARAVELEPLSAAAHAVHGISVWFTGRRREGAELQKRAIDLEPSFVRASWFASWMHAGAGRLEEARVYARQFYTRWDPNRAVSQALVDATVRVEAGPTDLATTVQVVQAWESYYGLDNAAAVLAFGSAGFPDSAFARLDLAITNRSEQLPGFVNYYHQVLGDDPRWQTVLTRMGLAWD